MFKIPVASFLQPSIGWSEERWDAEFALMKQAGFQFIILQSVVDILYDVKDDNTQNEDYEQYKLKDIHAIYPSHIEHIQNKCGGIDSLGNCFKAARKQGMKVMLAPVGDNRWWLYGWKLPGAEPGVTDLVNDSYFGRWVKQDAELSNRIASEISERYLSEYDDVFYGWYYWNEIWNMPLACSGEDNGILTKILANSLNAVLNHYSAITPGKPFLISPFMNFSISSAAGYGKMCKDLFALVSFRDGDIFCPQDSVGVHSDRIQELGEWTKCFKEAVDTKPGLKFWSNNENFSMERGPALLDRYMKQIQITSEYCEEHIVFSWNHHFNPLASTGSDGYNKTYLDCIAKGRLESESPEEPVLSYTGSSGNYTLQISAPYDNIGVAGYSIYSEDGNLCDTLYTTKYSVPDSYAVRGGTYYVEAFDFADNKSKKVKISI